MRGRACCRFESAAHRHHEPDSQDKKQEAICPGGFFGYRENEQKNIVQYLFLSGFISPEPS
jgi:hypothetical protein